MKPDFRRLRADYAHSDARWWLVPVILMLLTVAAAVSLPTLERQSAERQRQAPAASGPLRSVEPTVDDEAPTAGPAAAASRLPINPSPLEGDDASLEASRHASYY